MIGIKKEVNRSNSSYWFGCRKGLIWAADGVILPQSTCVQQKQHSCVALTGEAELAAADSKCLKLHIWAPSESGFPPLFWSLKTSPLHFSVIWATGGSVLCVAVFEVVNAQRSCAQLQRLLSSWNVCLLRGATDTTVVIYVILDKLSLLLLKVASRYHWLYLI